jgi:hypothetical protein
MCALDELDGYATSHCLNPRPKLVISRTEFANDTEAFRTRSWYVNASERE